MSSEQKPPIRRIINTVEKPVLDVTKLAEDVELGPLIVLAMESMAIDLARIREKAGNQKALDQKEARILQGYLKTLVELKKEKAKDVDWSKLSTEQAIQMLQALVQSRTKIEKN